MCLCTPNVRTPYCGKPGCEWPKPAPTPDGPNPRTVDLAFEVGSMAAVMDGKVPPHAAHIATSRAGTSVIVVGRDAAVEEVIALVRGHFAKTRSGVTQGSMLVGGYSAGDR